MTQSFPVYLYYILIHLLSSCFDLLDNLCILLEKCLQNTLKNAMEVFEHTVIFIGII
jgi:hypothetical protein